MDKKKAATKLDPISYDFKNLVGHDQVLRRFASVHAAGRLPSALLLEGREGIGKRLLAAAVASLPFCVYQVACGCCDGCRATIYDDNPDLFWIDVPGQIIKLDAVKQVQDHLSVKSATQGSVQAMRSATTQVATARRIVIIIDADLMNAHAANRLLKTLEEPSEDGMIIMTTSRKGNMLPTVLSRLVRWHVAPPCQEDAIKIVQKQLAGRGEEPCEQARLSDLLREVGLSPGAALERLSKAGGQSDQLEECLRQIIEGADECTVLDLANELGRGRKLGVDVLVEKLERLLNKSYREALCLNAGREGVQQTRGSFLSSAALDQRRKILNQAHRHAVRNKISLNAQLFLEAVGLAGK